MRKKIKSMGKKNMKNLLKNRKMMGLKRVMDSNNWKSIKKISNKINNKSNYTQRNKRNRLKQRKKNQNKNLTKKKQIKNKRLRNNN